MYYYHDQRDLILVIYLKFWNQHKAPQRSFLYVGWQTYEESDCKFMQWDEQFFKQQSVSASASLLQVPKS